MGTKRVSFIFFLFILAGACFGWELEFGGSEGYNYASAVSQYTTDSYVISANVFYETSNNTDILIFAVNEDGDSLWAYTFGDSLDNFASDIVVKDDGSIYVCGFTYREEVSDTVSNLYAAFAFKTDATGTVHWWNYYRYPGTYGSPTYPHGLTLSRIAENEDGFLLVGTRFTQGHILEIWASSLNDWIIQIDEAGETLWEQTTPGATMTSFIPYSGGIYSTGSSGFRINKVAFPTSIHWQSSFFSGSYIGSTANDVILTESGNVFAVGYERHYPHIDSVDHYYPVGAMLTPSGDSLWVGYISMSSESYAVKALNHIDSSGRITAITHTISSEIGLVMMDSDAVPLGSSEYPFSGDFTIEDACINSRGEYLVVGHKGNLPTRAWVVKLDSVEISAIEEGVASNPSNFQISAYPNPFNSAVAISAPGNTIIEIFNIGGRIVNTAILPKKGLYIWNPSTEMGSGVYLVRAKFDNEQVATKSLIYMK